MSETGTLSSKRSLGSLAVLRAPSAGAGGEGEGKVYGLSVVRSCVAMPEGVCVGCPGGKDSHAGKNDGLWVRFASAAARQARRKSKVDDQSDDSDNSSQLTTQVG